MHPDPIRILHLIASNFIGGPEKQILRHAVDARGSAYEIWIGSFKDQAERAEILNRAEQQGLPTYESPSSGKFDPRAVWDLASFLRRERIQVLCTHGFKANSIGFVAKKLAGVPHIAFCRGWTAETPRVRAYEFLDRRLLPYADRIICVSEAQANQLLQNTGMRDRVTVIQNAMLETARRVSAQDRAKLKVRLGFKPETRLIGAIGRLSVEKGQRYLIEAAPELVRQFSNLKIVLLGEGRERVALESQIERLGLKDTIQLLGFQQEIGTWLQALDVLANCSLTEGLPNVILEALALGTPVVATAVGGVPELIRHQETGLLVPSSNTGALSGALARIFREPDLAEAFRENGLMWVRNRFSPERQREALFAVYRQVIQRAPHPAKFMAGDAAINQEQCSTSSASKSRSEVKDPSSLPFISVIIPVRNEEAHLGAVLDGLRTQDYPPERYEILVVDGDSTDGTSDVVEAAAERSPARLKLIPNPRRLSSAGRNVGVRNSCGDLIVFVDGHCHLPSRQLLLDTAWLFETTGASCLCRPQPLTAPGNTWFQKVVADARASAIGHGLDSTIYSTDLEGFVDPTSSGASYRRSVFDQVRFYDERLDACEDVEFNYRILRAGLRSYISPKLMVQYQPRKTLYGLWKQMVRYGEGRRRFAGIHPEAVSVVQTLPAVFSLWVLLGALGAIGSRFIAVLYLLTVGIYSAALLVSSVWLGLRNSWRHLLTAPAVYATIHFGLGWGYLAEVAHAMLHGSSSLSAKTGTESYEANQAVTVANRTGTFPDSGKRAGSEELFAALRQKNPAVIGCAQSEKSRDLGSETASINAFTVDVEDYFHTEAMSGCVEREQWDQMPSRVEKATQRVFELLARHNVQGTFFFLGWVAERYPGLVREAVKLGHEIGCHSFWHRRVNLLTPSKFRSDTIRAKQAIEDAGGVRVEGYRAPSFSMLRGTEWAVEILAELEFRYDSSVHPVRHDLYSNASAPREPLRVGNGKILELPIATTRIFGNNLPVGGGGYFRILPYAYTKWGLSRFNREERRSGVVYLHPWEIDAGQPRLEASVKSRFRQYAGLAGAERKLDRLLGHFSFAPISTVFREELAADGEYAGNSARKENALAEMQRAKHGGLLSSANRVGKN